MNFIGFPEQRFTYQTEMMSRRQWAVVWVAAAMLAITVLLPLAIRDQTIYVVAGMSFLAVWILAVYLLKLRQLQKWGYAHLVPNAGISGRDYWNEVQIPFNQIAWIGVITGGSQSQKTGIRIHSTSGGALCVYTLIEDFERLEAVLNSIAATPSSSPGS